MTTNICESFNWLTPEFTVHPTDKNTVKIRGVALKGNAVSRNNRHYATEELKRAARTFIDAPITVNHADWKDKKNHIGKVQWMEYDEDGDMEYVGEVWKEPYVSMLRGKSKELHGVSVEADYLHNQCSVCGKKFFTEEDYQFHMIHEEFIRDSALEPHGMKGRALSVVAYKETPGYEGTTIELMEMKMKDHGLSQLLNVIVTQNKLKEEHQNKMSRIAVTQEQAHAAVGRGKKVNANLKEQEQDEHECPEGEHWSEEEGKCVPNKVTEQEHECPEGEHWDEEQQKCVANTVEEQLPSEEEVKAEIAKLQQQLEKLQPKVEVKDEISSEDERKQQIELDAIYAKIDALKDLLGQIEVAKLTEIKLPKPLKLDEGCRWSAQGFSSGEACVTAMQGKVDDPEAFCYSKMAETVAKETFNVYEMQTQLLENIRKTEGRTLSRDVQISKTLNMLSEALKILSDNDKVLLKHLDSTITTERETVKNALTETSNSINKVLKALPKDDTSWKKLFAEIPKDDLGWKQIKPYNDAAIKEQIANIKPYDDAPIKEAIANIKLYDDTAIKEQIANIKPYDDAPLKAEITTLKEAVAKKDEDIAMLRRAVEIADENVSTKDRITETKQKTIQEIIEKAAGWEKQTNALKEQLDKTTVRADNAEAKLSKYSQFKGTAKDITETAKHGDVTYSPEKDVQEKRKK